MMKKLVIALMAALLLAGCNAQADVPETTLPPEETTIPTEPVPSCYVENSPMERGTGGAVKQYQMDSAVTGLGMLGDNLLVCTDNRTLQLLDGETLEPIRTRELDHAIDWGEAGLVLGEQGLAYYDEKAGIYVTLDNNLITASTYVIQEEMLSQPVITQDFSDIYFATEDGIRVMHLAEGTSRLLREEHNQVLSVEGLLFNDGTLYYTRRTEAGEVQTCFVNASNGSIYHTADFQGRILSWDRSYAGLMVLDHSMGQTQWLISGNLSGRLQRLDSEYTWESAILLSNGWAVLQDISQVGLTLYCYDMSTGALISQVIMPQQYSVLSIGCTDGEKIWLCDSGLTRFFCWNTSVSGRGNSESALVANASLDEPDEDGLAQCELLAQVIGERCGVEITIREENNRTSGVDYAGYPDFRPDLYNEALRELERVLKDLPENFLRKVGRYTDSGKLEICLVDDYDPGTKTSQATGSIDVADGNTAVRVSMCENIREIFFHELFHVLEVQIMNVSDGFKSWEALNPEGFAYVNSYAPYYEGELKNSAYLKAGRNYFADDYGLISAREDRAQVFLYACLDGQEERFASDAMQEKLGQICDMLRKYFSISDDVTPLWEQYRIVEETTEE